MFAAIVGQSWAVLAHPYNLEVNGVDWIDSVRHSSIRIEMPGPGSNGSMSVDLWDPDYSISITSWDQVRYIEHAATRPILFGGFVQSVRYIPHKGPGGGRTIAIQCVGYGILLRKRVVTWASPTVAEQPSSATIVSVVNRYGGLLTALCAGSRPSVDGPYETDATYSIPDPGTPDVGAVVQRHWAIGKQDTASPFGFLPESLETPQAMDAWLGSASGASWYYNVDTPGSGEFDWSTAAPWLFWVDSAARVCVYPILPETWITGADIRAALYDGGTVPAITVTTATTGIVDQSYETDRVELVTLAVGATEVTPPVDIPSPERTGDLQTVWTDSDSFLGNIAAKAELVASGERQDRVELVYTSATPMDLWPGLSVRVTRTGMCTDLDVRISAVGISFLSATQREYRVTLGSQPGSYVGSR